MSPQLFLGAAFGAFVFLCVPARAGTDVASQPEADQVSKTLMDYIEGTAVWDPARLRNAFHPDFKLYAVSESNELIARSGEQYIANIPPGQKNNRIGRILSIDVENNAATAKVEILMPNYRIYTDYFMLLKYQGAWKIIHKSYTWKEAPPGARAP